MLYYTIPYYCILISTIRYCTILYYTTLDYTILYYTTTRSVWEPPKVQGGLGAATSHSGKLWGAAPPREQYENTFHLQHIFKYQQHIYDERPVHQSHIFALSLGHAINIYNVIESYKRASYITFNIPKLIPDCFKHSLNSHFSVLSQRLVS